MKNVKRNSRLSKLILMVLIAAMVLSLAACGSEKNSAVSTGEKTFTFEVVDVDGSSESFTITTEAVYVGEALIQGNYIAGEDGAYGLYVKTANGITYDYDTDGVYWGFYVNGEYAMSGIDKTEIEDGAVYSLKAEK